MGETIVAAAAGVIGVLAGTLAQAILAGRQRGWGAADERRRWERDKRLDAYVDFSVAFERYFLEAIRASVQAQRGTSNADEERPHLLSLFAPMAEAGVRIHLLASEEVCEATRTLEDKAMVLMQVLEDAHAWPQALEACGAGNGQWRSAVRRDMQFASDDNAS